MLNRSLLVGLIAAIGLGSKGGRADDEAFRPPDATISVVGGVSRVNTKFAQGGTQLRDATLTDFSNLLLSLRANYYFLNWLGGEAEVLGDFMGIRPNTQTQELLATPIAKPAPTSRWEGRLGPSLRWTTATGFMVSGAIGFGISAAPVIDTSNPTTFNLTRKTSLGVSGRVGASYTRGIFEGAAGVAALFSPGAVSTIEPRVWLGARILEMDRTRISAGVDASFRLERPLSGGNYSGETWHFGLALQGSFLPVRASIPVVDTPPAKPIPVVVPKTGPGRVTGRIVAAATRQPVVDAQISIGDADVARSDAEGRFKIDRMLPGAVNLQISAAGFSTANEMVQISPEEESILDVSLEVLGKGSPATVRGLVRNLAGQPLRAQVSVKGLAVAISVSPEGRFVVQIPGGTYTFVISAPGYETQMKHVTLSDGDQAIFHAEMQKVSR